MPEPPEGGTSNCAAATKAELRTLLPILGGTPNFAATMKGGTPNFDAAMKAELRTWLPPEGGTSNSAAVVKVELELCCRLKAELRTLLPPKGGTSNLAAATKAELELCCRLKAELQTSRAARLQPLQGEPGDLARVFQIEFVFDVRPVGFDGFWAEM